MSNDVMVLRDYVLKAIGPTPATWPGGWPGQAEAALIDAVFSVRARYGDRVRGTGVYGAVVRWKDTREDPADDLRHLAEAEEGRLRELTNSGKISGKYKASVVIDAARALTDAGIVRAADVADRLPDARSAYLSVRGCGPVTWSYFRMLLGLDDVKPDTWVMRFVQDRLPHVVRADEAARLVSDVAFELGVRATDLDHAIWRYRRTQPVVSARQGSAAASTP